MAKVELLLNREPNRVSVHSAVEATYHVFTIDEETYLQIDTYGAPDRQIPSKVSQSIQLGKLGRNNLLTLLRELEDQ